VTPLDALVALAIVVGLVGVVVPAMPGLSLVLGAVLVWSQESRSTTGWVVLAVVTLLFLAGQVAKYLLPGRRLREAGVPASTMAAGAVLGVVGFFVVPVVGVFLGFVLGVYLAELLRSRSHARAWPQTVHALRAAGWSILIELAAGLLMAGAWVLGAAAG